MLCPLCRQRKARRACPALGHEICAVCCGTKRLVEIRCPADCGYLASSRAHPPAVVQRQHDRDFRVLFPTISGLTERQTQLFFLLASSLGQYRSDGLQRTLDRDVADAAGAQAATYETANRGVIYEHQPDSLPAQRLQQEMKIWLKDLAERGGRALERDAAIVLRRIETGAKDAAKALGGSETAYIDLVTRVVGQAQTMRAHSETGEGRSDDPIDLRIDGQGPGS